MKQIICFFAIVSLVLSSPRKAPYRIEPYIFASTNSIIGESKESWELAQSFGIGARLPVAKLPMNISLSLGITEVSGVNSSHNFGSLLTSVLLEYEHKFHERFRLITGAGVANMLITAGDEVDITKPFAGESENEFGLAIAIEPTLCIKKFSIGLRIQDRHIYSAPKSVNFISLSLIGGWRF